MDDLVAFLKARLDEDEAAAKAAAGVAGPDWTWKTEVPEGCGEPTDYVTSMTGALLLDTRGGIESEAPFVARYDPARALREVEAKRQRLALYLDARESLAAALEGAPALDDPAVAHSYVRERVNANQASGRFAAFEMSVRLDAVIWCDHPDYRPEWKP